MVCNEPHGCACGTYMDTCTHHCDPDRNEKPCGDECVALEKNCDELHGTACHNDDMMHPYVTHDVNGGPERFLNREL